MKNPIKVLAITNTILLVSLIVFVLVAKSRTESGEKVGYFLKDAEEPTETSIISDILPYATPPVTSVDE